MIIISTNTVYRYVVDIINSPLLDLAKEYSLDNDYHRAAGGVCVCVCVCEDGETYWEVMNIVKGGALTLSL